MPVRDRASALKFVTIGDRPFDPVEADRQRVRLLSGETNDTGGPLEYEPKPQKGQRPERISRTTCFYLGCAGCVLVAVAVGVGVMSAFREQSSPPPPPKPLPPMSPPQPPLSPPRSPPPQTPPLSPPPFNQTWACFTCILNATNTTSTSLTVRRKLSSLGLDYFPILKVAVANFLGLPVGDVSITQDVSGMFTCCCESRNYTQLQYLLTTEDSSDFRRQSRVPLARRSPIQRSASSVQRLLWRRLRLQISRRCRHPHPRRHRRTPTRLRSHRRQRHRHRRHTGRLHRPRYRQN